MKMFLDFIYMGGYAGFVWPAFGLTALLMIGLLVQTQLGKKTNQRTFELLKSSLRQPATNKSDETET